jgi:hypothetical protein
MSDLPQRLRFNATIPLVMEAADRIEALEAEVAEWQQAASVEAGLRREFYDRATALEALAQGYDTAREVFTDRIEALEAALREIAGQKTTSEFLALFTIAMEYADFEDSYDIMIVTARDALAGSQDK